MRLEISVALECVSQRPCAELWPVVMFTGRMIVEIREEMMVGPAVDFYFRPHNVSGSFAFLEIYTYILGVQRFKFWFDFYHSFRVMVSITNYKEQHK